MLADTVQPAVIPEAVIAATLTHLNDLGLEASLLQPDEGPAEIIVSYLPAAGRPEGFWENFYRTNEETSYYRIWAATDGTMRVTEDATSTERTASSMQEALDEVERLVMRHDAWVKGCRLA